MFSHLKPAETRVYFSLFANFIVLGISNTIFGALVPLFVRRYNWDYTIVGLVFAAGSIGYFSSNLIGGFLIKRIDERIVILIAPIIAAVSLVLFSLSSVPVIAIFISMCIGLGQGSTEVITNTVIVRLEAKGESRLMNLMHGAFCIGAVVGPILVGSLIAANVDFTVVFVVAGLLQGAVAVVLGMQRYKGLGNPAMSEVDKHQSFRALIGDRLIVALAFTLFLYVGVELAMSNWVAEFFVGSRGFDPADAALMVSLYWTGLLIGRVGLSFFYRGKNQEGMLALLATVSIVFYAATILLPSNLAASISSLCTGLAFSGIYPLAVILVGKRSHGNPKAMGFASALGGVGSLTFPFATGGLAKVFGLRAALTVTLCFNVLLAVLALWTFVSLRRQRLSQK